MGQTLPVKLLEELLLVFEEPEDGGTAVASAEPEVGLGEGERLEEVWRAPPVLPGVKGGDLSPHHQLIPGIPAPGHPGLPQHDTVHLHSGDNQACITPCRKK